MGKTQRKITPLAVRLIANPEASIFTHRKDINNELETLERDMFYYVAPIELVNRLLDPRKAEEKLYAAPFSERYKLELIASAPGLLDGSQKAFFAGILKFTKLPSATPLSTTLEQPEPQDDTPTNLTALKQHEHVASETLAMNNEQSIDEQITSLPHRGRGVILYDDIIVTKHALDRIKSRIGNFAGMKSLVRAVLKNREFAVSAIDKDTGTLSKKIDYKGFVYVFSPEFDCLITTFPSYNTRSGQKQYRDFANSRTKAFKRKSLEKYDRAKNKAGFSDDY